jgi:hypothetical protein
VKNEKLLDKVDCLIKEAPIKKDGAVDEFVATFKTLEAKNNFLTNNPGNPNDVSAKLPVQEQVAITLPIVFTKKINGELKEFTVNNENGIDDFAINYLCNLDQIQNDNKYKDNPDTNLSWNGLSAYQKAILFWESKIKNQSKGEMPPSTFSVQDGFKTYFNFKEKSYTWMRMAFSNLYKQANLKHNITITGQPSLIPKAVDDSLNKAKIDFTEEEKNIIKELEEQNITLDCEKYNQFSLSLDNSPTPKQRKVFNEMINSLETNGAKQITFDGIKYTFVLDDRNKILTLTKPQLSPVESDVVKKLKEKKIDLIPNSDGGYSAILKNPTYKDKFLKRLKELGAIDIKSFNSDIGETVYTFKKLEEAKLQELAKFDASQGRSFGSGSGTVSRIRNRVRRVRSGVDSGIINRVRSGVGSGTGSGKKDKRRGIVDVPKGHFYKPTNNKNDNKKAEYNLQTALYKTPDEIGYYKDIDTVDDVKNGLDNAKRIVKKPPPRQRLKEDYEKKETQVLQRKDRDTETRNPWENGALLFIRIVLDILTLGLLELIGFFDKNKKMTTSLTKNSTTKSEQNLPEKTITKSQHATLTKTPHKNKIIYSLKDYQPSFIKSH